MNQDLVDRVISRDLHQSWFRSGTDLPFPFWARQGRTPCVAAFLDPNGSVTCSGRITMEHVTPEYGRTGKKAADREEEIVSLCEAHHLWSFAGHIWALANKDLTRAYLKELYP